MEQGLNILYTCHLRGDLDILPSLHTFLAGLQRQYAGRTLKLDAGHACDNAAWHCAQTGGRSALLVLDAMGYAAANTHDFLTNEGREKLTANLMGMAVLRDGEVWMQAGVVITTSDEIPPGEYELHIVLHGSEATRLDGRTLHLAAVQARQVGVVQIGPSVNNGRLSIQHQEIVTLPDATLPDPTIAATVEFVLSEARYYGRGSEG
jgi:hypothetical protein